MPWKGNIRELENIIDLVNNNNNKNDSDNCLQVDDIDTDVAESKYLESIEEGGQQPDNINNEIICQDLSDKNIFDTKNVD